MSKYTHSKMSDKDYEFMHSLSAAVLQSAPKKIKMVLYFWLVTIILFFVWANFALIDEIARGDGDIVPSGENQMIQNLEGGIIKEILVKEGEIVEKGQLLVKIDNLKSESSFMSNGIKADALNAKITRLIAESSGENFKVTKKLRDKIPLFIENERSLYRTNKAQLNAKIKALNEEHLQKEHALTEALQSKKTLQKSLELIHKEVLMTKPMVAKGVRSKIEFLKLQREENTVKEKYDGVRLSIPRLRSAIKQVKNTIEETNFKYRSDAKLALNEAVSELHGYRANSDALQDQVKRTLVRAPSRGIVQKLFIHTLGGVIKPGQDILEIVPTDSTLLVEVKIKPSDIAFIYFGQKAIVKFSAYDFSIYGGLEGEVMHISADTITDEKDNVFYTVRIKTSQNFLERNKKKLKIIPGMTVSVDIITGRKSVLDYILKPILKTKQYTFTER